MAASVNIIFRPEQLKLHQERQRFALRVCHRRFGKTWQGIAELFAAALQAKHKAWRGFFIGPTYKQVKRAAWDYLKAFAKTIPGTEINEAELRVDFPNGARITLLGAESYDSLRGQYAHAVILDETQLIPSEALTTVILPMLADYKGWLIAQGTPAGRHNLLFELHERAERDPDWSCHVMPVTATDIIDASELKMLRKLMTDAEWGQEMECSFNAAIRGAYLAREMQAATEQGRVTTVKHEAALDVVVSLDLGWSDLMVATFWQNAGTEHRAIACRAYQHTKLVDMVRSWKQLPFPVDHIVLPHDGEVTDLSAGQTRRQIIEQASGVPVTIAPRCRDKHEAIEQVRHMLPHCWFDQDECKTLVEALFGYRSDYDEVKRVQKMTPLHSWESHYFDSVQTYALGRPNSLVGEWGPLPRSALPISKRLRA